MNWLKRIAQLPQMPGVGSSQFPQIWQQLMTDQIDANQAAKMLQNEKGSCCAILGEQLANTPNELRVRGLYNALCIDEQNKPKPMPQNNMNPTNSLPAGSIVTDENGQPVENNQGASNA